MVSLVPIPDSVTKETSGLVEFENTRHRVGFKLSLVAEHIIAEALGFSERPNKFTELDNVCVVEVDHGDLGTERHQLVHFAVVQAAGHVSKQSNEQDRKSVV